MNQKSIIGLFAISLSISSVTGFSHSGFKRRHESSACQKAIKSAVITIIDACEDAEAGEVVNFKVCKTAIREAGLPAVKGCLLGPFEDGSKERGRAGKIMSLIENIAMEFIMPLVEAGMEMPMHGKYCGPNYGDAGFSDDPVDELDAVCMLHDRCYIDHGQFDCDCDEIMIRDLLVNFREGNFKGEQYFKALGSLVYFILAQCSERNANSAD